jgi:predicted metal-dependent hydrolase
VRHAPTAGPPASSLPPRLLKGLAELLLEAIHELRERPAPTTAAAVSALAILRAYEDRTGDSGAATPLADVLGGARRAVPWGGIEPDAGVVRLCPAFLSYDRAAELPGGSVCLPAALRRHAAPMRARIAVYLDVLERFAQTRPRALPVLERELLPAVLLFNAGLYFEVHEVLEALWRGATGSTKTFLQGLLQIAVALHHVERGNRSGAAAQLSKGTDKIRRSRAAAPAVDSDRLLADLVPWEQYLLRSGSPAAPVPALPRLRMPPITG